MTKVHTICEHGMKLGAVIKVDPFQGTTFLRKVTQTSRFSYTIAPLNWFDRICYAVIGRVL